MEYKTTGSILHTQVWCVYKKLEEMGIEENSWHQLSINMKNIFAIKEIHGDFADGKSGVYFLNDYFILNVDFSDMVNLWTPYQ